jgi:AdoMet-dependent heme synthase
MQSCLSAKDRFNRFISRVEHNRIPLWAHLDLTYRCNLSCIHCYCRDLSPSFFHGEGELSYDQVCRVIDELALAGSLYLTLSGGEVLLRADFLDIAAYARERSFALTIYTNGTQVDEARVQAICSLSPLAVEMSIYGVTADVHDGITQVKGSFAGVINALQILKSAGVRVIMKSVIMQPNIHEAKKIPQFCFELGADDYRYTIEIASRNDGSRLPQFYQLSSGKMQEIISLGDFRPQQEHEYSDRPFEKPLCASGTIGCYISPSGDVFPCPQLLIPMGNVRNASFERIWHAQSSLRDQLALLNTYDDLPECHSCDYVGTCRKCIGLSCLETGDMRKCYQTHKEITRIQHELGGWAKSPGHK